MTDGTVTCPYCGAEWPEALELRFCGECGSKLGALSPQITDRERRTLTVLFADISGFTAFSEARDPEVVEAAVDGLLSDLGDVVDDYGGYVDKYLGDALMAVFGAPDANEDDPLRAVRTGLDLLSVADAFVDRPGEGLSLSVGINTGEVLWSTVGGGDYTVTGDAVNVAKRLEERAPDDAVLVSEAVRQRTADRIRYARADPVTIEGRETPVQASLATGTVDDPAREPATASADVDAPLVGRDDALSRLLGGYEASGPACLAVTGPAGIGKSRLLEAVRSRLADRSPSPWVGVGRCSRHADPPLEPFGDVLLSAAGAGRGDADAGRQVVATVREDLAGSGHDPDRRETLAHLLAVSAGLSVPETPVTDLPPGRLQSEARRAWLAWLRERASDRPVVLAVEDVQWADEATRALLAALADRLETDDNAGDAGITFVATSRSEDAVPGGFEPVELTPLDAADARAIAESVLDGPVGDDLPAFLQAQAGGNPYFVAELLRYLLANDALVAADDGYRVEPDAGPDVPETLDGLLVGRIDALPPAARETAKGASVVGQRFWRGHLAAVLDRDADGPIETLAARELVHPREESTLPDDEEFTFEHALLRDAAYGLLPESDRRELHAAAATELQAVANGETDALAGRIARHHERAGEYDAAVEWYRRAGDAAADAYATADAIDSYETAIDLGREHGVLDDATVAAIKAAIANAHIKNSEYDRALAAVEEGLSVAPAGSRERCQLLGRRAEAHTEASDFEQGQEDARRQLELATDLGARGYEASATLQIGLTAEYRGEFDRAREYYERSCQVARDVGNREREATALDGLGIALHRQGEYDRARECLQRALDIRQAVGERFDAASTLNNLGLVAMSLGEYERAREYYEESLSIARDIGDRRGEAIAVHNLGEIANERGAYERARERFAESLAIEHELGNRRGEAISRRFLGDVACEQGDLDRARAAYEESLATSRDLDATDTEAESLHGLGVLSIEEGDLDRARERFERALSLQEEIGDSRGVALTRLAYGRLALARGDTGLAHERAEQAKETAAELDAPHVVGRSRRLLGRIAAADGATDAAREHWRAALETFEDVDAPEDALATLRRLVDAAPDDERAREWAERARNLLADAPQSVVDRHEEWVEGSGTAPGDAPETDADAGAR